jgi:hypothetical protein
MAPAVTAPELGRKRKARRKAPSCEECFFGCRGLCALDLDGPCPTFRPDSPEGLVPPRQPALLLRDPEPDTVAAGG